MNTRIQCTAMLVTGICSTTVLAHAGHATGVGLSGGFLHALGGLDHLVAAMLIGLWAATGSGVRKYLPLAVFPLFTIIGSLLAVYSVQFVGGEFMLALSILTVGLLLFRGVTVRVTTCIVVAVFALFYGHVHMLEIKLLASPFAYVIGLVVVSVALLGAGFGAGLCLQGRRTAWLLPAVGAFVSGVSAVLLLGTA